MVKFSSRIFFLSILFLLLLFLVGDLVVNRRGSLSGIIGSDSRSGISRIVVDQTQDLSALGYSGQRKIVSDKEGNFYVTYRKKYQDYYGIFVARLEKKSNNQWGVSGTDKPIAFVESNQRVPSITLDSKNVLHVVWYGTNSGDDSDERQIKYSRSNDGGRTWDKWKNISLVLGFSGSDLWQEHPNILVGANGYLYVVWEGKDENSEYQQIKFSRSTDGGNTWRKWMNVYPFVDNSQSRPTILEGVDKKLYIFSYSTMGTGSQQIQVSSSADFGNTWSKWFDISRSAFDSRHISATIDNSGILYVTWRANTKKDGPSQIFYSSFKNGIWSEPLIISSSSSYQFFPSITVDENQTIYVLWVETDDSSNFPKEQPKKGKIYIASKRDGDNQSFERRLLAEGENNLYPNFPEQISSGEVPLLYLREGKLDSEIIFEIL